MVEIRITLKKQKPSKKANLTTYIAIGQNVQNFMVGKKKHGKKHIMHTLVLSLIWA